MMFERPIPHAGFPGEAPDDLDFSHTPPRVVRPFELRHYFQSDDPMLEVADALKSCIEAEFKGELRLDGCLQDLVTAAIKAWIKVNDIEGDLEKHGQRLTELVGRNMKGPTQ